MALIAICKLPELVPCGGDCYGEEEWELMEYVWNEESQTGEKYTSSDGVCIEDELEKEDIPDIEEILYSFREYVIWCEEAGWDPLELFPDMGLGEDTPVAPPTDSQ